MVVRELLNPEQAAELLGLSRQTIYARLRDGTIKGVRIGSRWIIPSKPLLDLLANSGDRDE